MVLIGDLGGKLKTAGGTWITRATGKGHRTIANLYLTLLHRAVKPRDTFGQPDPNLKDVDQTGPLAELFG